jgi:hypothetical protein
LRPATDEVAVFAERLLQVIEEGRRTTRRTFPPAWRAGLADLQESACFYCGERIGARAGQVDHVVPWSRWPNDAVENLVLADACNTHKRDHLPGLAHIDRWVRRLVTHGDDLVALADAVRWESDRERSVALARTAYAHLPVGTPLWAGRDDFREDDPALIVARLADLPPAGRAPDLHRLRATDGPGSAGPSRG